jgi:hypothetical protein
MPSTAKPSPIMLVCQQKTDDCAIATVAMIASVSYSEVWEKLSPPPSVPENVDGYHTRETAFLKEKDWWPAAQFKLEAVANLDTFYSLVDSQDEVFRDAVVKSQRLRFILPFHDGTKPDHAVVWDRERGDVIFDPSRGIIALSDLLGHCGKQTYSGILGMTAFCYSPGQPMDTLVRTLNSPVANVELIATKLKPRKKGNKKLKKIAEIILTFAGAAIVGATYYVHTIKLEHANELKARMSTSEKKPSFVMTSAVWPLILA